MTTIKEVAQLAEVSIATVSKIRNGNDKNISAATRERVNRIMRETNYVPNAVAKGLKSKQTRTLGFILPDIRNPFFPEIARGIEDIAWENHFSVTFCNTDNDARRESDALNLLQSKMVDGVILTRSMFGDSADYLDGYDFPVVVVDRKGQEGNSAVGEIAIDVEAAFVLITEHLLSSGARKIAYISSAGSYDGKRYLGFKKALDEAGYEVNPSMIYLGKYDVETGIEGVRAILAGNKPDAIVCGNDLIAVGAMGELKERGILIPRDIKITGFDDIYFSRYLSPSLTTVRQPAYEMGAEAARMLISYLVDSKPLHEKKLAYQLIVRESTSTAFDSEEWKDERIQTYL